MKGLINVQIETKEGINVVSSRVIAKELGKEHKNVLRDLDKIFDSSNVSRQFIKSEYENRGKMYREYLLTKDGFTLYMFNIQGYNDFKMAYINEFNRMERELRENKPKLPQTYKEALIELVKVLDDKEKLEERNKRLIHDNKTYTSTEIAKELGFRSARAFNEDLKEKKIQYKVNGTWVLRAEFSQKGYESIKQTELENKKVVYERKWTSEGREWLVNEVYE